MYLTGNSLLDLIKHQYFFKLKAYDLFTGLFVVHLIAFLLSFNGVGSVSTHYSDVIASFTTFSNDIFLILTMVWMFITGAQFPAKKQRDSDFSFPSTPYSSVLSSEAMLATVAFVSGIATYVAGIALKVFVVLFKGQELLSMSGFYLPWGELARGMFVTILYMLLVVSLGFTAGMLTQWKKIFAFLLPVLVIGDFFYAARANQVDDALIVKFITFFATETSLGLFVAKVVVTTLALFAASVFVSGKLEVRR